MLSNLEYYRAFFYAANYSNITKAAEQLCLTQSAVSQSIKKLEDELDCSLFIRSPHGLTFTAEGEILYRHVKRAFEELQMGEQDIRFFKKYKSNELKIGAAESALYILNGPVPSIFREQNPDVHISFVGASTAETCQKLQDEDIELAFLISPIPEEYDFDLYKLIDIQDVFVGSEKLPINFDENIKLEDIVNYPLMLPPPESAIRQWVDQLFMKKGMILKPDYIIRSTALTISLLTDVNGVTVLPEPYVLENASRLKIREIKLEEKLPARTLYLASKSNCPLSQIAHRFIEVARQ